MNNMSTDELQRLARTCKNWWHSIKLGEGVITEGRVSHEFLAAQAESLRLPDLRGKTVLDVGAWDGFFSFEAEKRGAARVVALDHYVWSIDLDAKAAYDEQCAAQGVAPEQYETLPEMWKPDELPGRKGFDLARTVLGSRVEPLVADFMAADLRQVGVFDVVLFLGVLYHMANPFQALRRVAEVTGELAVITTQAVVFPGYDNHALCQFFESNEYHGDVTNWWAPNEKALVGMCRAAGFRHVDILAGPPRAAPARPDAPPRRPWSRFFSRKPEPVETPGPAPHHYIAIAHAWK